MTLKYQLTGFAVLFVAALTVAFLWYSPVLFKGYSPNIIGKQIILARNLSDAGIYGMENNHGVLLASDLVKDYGEVSSVGNKLTARLYGRIFNFFGVPSWNNLILISTILNALALLIFAFTVFYLFRLRIAIIFSFIYALLPFNWAGVYSLGSYEFAFVFLSLFFLCFVFGINLGIRLPINKNLVFARQIIYLALAGVFLSLAAMAKEAFLLLIPILFLYLLFGSPRAEWRQGYVKALGFQMAAIFIPVVIIFSIFYLPGFFQGDNIYKSGLFGSKPAKEFDFAMAGHLFPDYYTFRFDREDFLRKYKAIRAGDEGILKSLSAKKFAANIGEDRVNIFERIIVGSYLFFGQLFRFISLEEIGGPFIFGLILFGVFYLRKKDNFLFPFFIWWFGGTLFLLSFIVLAGRSHLMDFGWALALLAALGTIYLAGIFRYYFNLNYKKELLTLFLIFITASYGLLLVDHIAWGKAYDNNMLKLRAYADLINQSGVRNQDVIATALRQDEIYTINFLTDKSIIVFRPATLEKILAENKLPEVFSEFNIKYILGYSDDLSGEIVRVSEAKNIASDSIVYAKPETSPFKVWFMGLVR